MDDSTNSDFFPQWFLSIENSCEYKTWLFTNHLNKDIMIKIQVQESDLSLIWLSSEACVLYYNTYW